MITVGETIPIKINNILVDSIIEIVTEEFGSLYVSGDCWKHYEDLDKNSIIIVDIEEVMFINGFRCSTHTYHLRYWKPSPRPTIYIIEVYSSEEEYIKQHFCFGMN